MANTGKTREKENISRQKESAKSQGGNNHRGSPDMSSYKKREGRDQHAPPTVKSLFWHWDVSQLRFSSTFNLDSVLP
jgi:hypothetical protein